MECSVVAINNAAGKFVHSHSVQQRAIGKKEAFLCDKISSGGLEYSHRMVDHDCLFVSFNRRV
jgi:hypothetical protein